MKNAKKIGIALALVVLLGVIAIFTAIAADSVYTGSLYWLEIHVERFEKIAASDRENREAAILEIDEYLATTPVDPTLEGYADLALVVKNAKIAFTKEYLADIDATNNSAEKASALKNAKKWFELTPYTLEDMEGEEYKNISGKISSIAVPVAQAMLNAIDEDNLADFTVGYDYKVFSSFMQTTEFDEESDEYKALMSECDRLRAKYEAAVEELRMSIISNAPLDQYGYGIGYSTGFEAGQPVPSASNTSALNSLGQSVPTQLVTETEIIDEQLNLTNNYRTMRFAGVTASTYFNVSYSGAGRGMVFEFDITTMSELPNKGILLQTRPSQGTNTWFQISSTGVMTYRNTTSETAGTFVGNDKIIVPGAWTHISFIFDPANPNEGELYIDYCRAVDKNGDPVKVKFDSKNWGFIPAQIRIGNTASSKGEFSIDNLRFTVGTAHRDERYLDNLPSDSARFLYFADYLNNEKNAVPGRIVAYTKMTDLMGDFALKDDAASKEAKRDIYKVLDKFSDNAEIKNAVELYNNSNIDTIRANYEANNLSKLTDIVDELRAIVVDPSSESLNDRNAKITEANVFIENNLAFIPACEEFDNLQLYLAEAMEQHALDTNVSKFIAAMTAFDQTESYALLEIKYQEAAELYEAIGAKNAESLINATGYADFLKYYHIYENAAIEIGNALGMKHSKDIVNAVNYLLARYPDEKNWKLTYIEDVNNPGDLNGDGAVSTEDVALAEQNNKDFEFIDNYLTIIRKMVYGEYDKNYIGVDGAVQRFEILNAHYYDILQKGHAEFFKEQLDNLAATQSYIAKEGIIAYLKRYKENNDVDVSHPAIAPLQVRMDAYEGELEHQVDSYADLLRQNTSYFVNMVKMFDTALTYVEKKELFDEATLYYYEMNATSNEVDVAGAIIRYSQMAAELEVVENASEEFIRNVELLPASETTDDYYRYLVGAMLQYENIDESIDGVAKAKAAYLAAYNEYNAEVDAINSEIAETGAALGSLRANCGLSAIISAFIERIFNFG